MEKINVKQEYYLLQLTSIKRSILKHCDPYKLNYEAQLALLVLDGEGWLFDDMVQAIRNYLFKLKARRLEIKKTLGNKKNEN